MGHALLKPIIPDVIPDAVVGSSRNGVIDRFRAVPANGTRA